MSTRTQPTRIDPAADAAALLRRLGFAILVFAVPIAAMGARRSTVILVPIGTALLVLAALLDGANASYVRMLRQGFASPAGLSALLLVGWSALSIVWTPFPETALEKIVNIVGTVAVAVAGIASLPERMRSSNLYLVPVGAGLAAIAAVGVELYRRSAGSHPTDADSLERGLVILSVAVWPGVAWLASRARLASAAALIVLAALAAIISGDRAPIAAMIAGMAVYGVARVSPRAAIRILMGLLPAILALAPLFPFLFRPFLKAFHGPLYPGATALRIWADVMGSEPVRLITGHGLDTSIRARFVGLLPTGAPQTFPFEIWYELGLVGALAAAAALFFALAGAARLHAALIPGVLAAYASAFTVACVGTANAQAWWLSALGAVVLTFVAVERGQFRTRRPDAPLLRVRRKEPAALGSGEPARHG